MKEIIVYLCDKESYNKKELENHEIECKAAAAKKELREKEINKYIDNFINSFSFDNLADNINTFLEAVYDDSFEDIHFDVSYNKKVSNTHSAPIDGVTNFGCHDDLPRGYPGFTGKITGTYSRNKKTLSFYTDRFASIPGIHTGTGSGSGEKWQYAVRIYMQDFPHFEKDFNKRHLLEEAKKLLIDNDYQIEESYKG